MQIAGPERLLHRAAPVRAQSSALDEAAEGKLPEPER